MFTQISINAIPTNGWMDSTLTVYKPIDSQGFTTPAQTYTIGALPDTQRSAALVAVAQIIQDAIAGGFFVVAITVTNAADHIETTIDNVATVNTLTGTNITSVSSENTGTLDPSLSGADAIIYTDVATTYTYTTTSFAPIYVVTAQRPQLSIAITRQRRSDGASGTIVVSSESYNATVRDALLSFASNY
jgi:hypothetical protein